MASPYNDMLIAVLVGLGALVVLLSAVLYWRNRQLRELRQIGDRVAVAARAATSRCGSVRTLPRRRIGTRAERRSHDERCSANMPRAPIAKPSCAAWSSPCMRRSPSSATHLLANARFAEICGASARRSSSAGASPTWCTRTLPSCSASTCAATARARRRPSGWKSNCARGAIRARRVHFARISYDAQPALLVSAVEISARAEPAHGGRARTTAWTALDSLSESVLTTDIDGRIVYVNRAGESLLGKPMADAIGHTLGEVMNLVDEADRKTLGDPVRQSLTTGARINLASGSAIEQRHGERSTSLRVAAARCLGGPPAR